VERAAVALSSWSRFANDPRIPGQRVRELYRIWARGCLHEGVVAGRKGQRARRRDAGGEGARPPRLRRCRFRWTGLGPALLDRALAAAGATSAHVTTQAAKVSALRLYKARGFACGAVEAVLQLWLDVVS